MYNKYAIILRRTSFWRILKAYLILLGKVPAFQRTDKNKKEDFQFDKEVLLYHLYGEKSKDNFNYQNVSLKEDDKIMLELINNLSQDSKQTILDLMKKLK